MSKQEAIKKELIKFQIRAVDLLNSSLQLPKEEIIDQSNFNFNVNLEQKIDHNLKSFIVITTVDITSAKNITEKLGSISTACLYTIENFDELIKADSKQPDISDDVLDILNSISISSTRGVMSQVFRGTFLHNAILPIVDPKAFKKSNQNQQL